MKLRLSDDGSRLDITEGYPIVQGIFGLGLAAFAGMLLYQAIKSLFDPTNAFWPGEPSHLTLVGIAAGCLVGVTLGLVIAVYRSGTTLDRQVGKLIRWQRLGVDVTQKSRDLRRFDTLCLRSEMREAADSHNRTRSNRYYRIYVLVLSDPHGAQAPIGETTSTDQARAASRQIAEFLGIRFTDQALGEQPVPVGGGSVNVDLPVVGRVGYESPTTTVAMTPYVFRECLDPPPDTRVVIERCPDGVTLTIPPAGIWYGSKGLFPFGLIWSLIVGVMSAVLLMSGKPIEHNAWVAYATLIVFSLVGVGALMQAIQMGRRRAVFAVVGDRLLVLQTGPFSKKRWEWGRGDLHDVRTGPSGMAVNGVPVIELQVAPRTGSKVGFLAGHDEEELRWVATEVRRSFALKDALQDGPTGSSVAGTSFQPGQ
jgi:hypothetical protein